MRLTRIQSVLVTVSCLTVFVGATKAAADDTSLPESAVNEPQPLDTSTSPELNFLTRNILGQEYAEASGLSVRGWLSQGITLSGESQKSNFNGPLSFNDRRNEYQMNQLYMIIE